MESLSSPVAWIVFSAGYLAPLAHVILSKNGGAWVAPKDAQCPFAPRIGWIVIILCLGIFGWLLFLNSRQNKFLKSTKN